MATAEWGGVTFAGDTCSMVLHYNTTNNRPVDLTVVNNGTGTLVATLVMPGGFTASHSFGPGSTVIPLTGAPALTKVGSKLKLGSLSLTYG